ncbi:MAG TPA: hypothetical protein VEF06_00240 [Bryobacteraceae bacterium]|nr:hypothetical protein [Bryobacteraceae bacterium]
MLTYHACSKCDAPVRRSRRKNLFEFLIGPIMLPYRCTVCDRREMKLRFIDMEPNSKPEDTDLIIAQPTERELEEERKAGERAAERAAKKAAKLQEKEQARKAKAAAAASRQSSTSDEEEEQISPS